MFVTAILSNTNEPAIYCWPTSQRLCAKEIKFASPITTADGTPTVEIEIDEKRTLQDEAAIVFGNTPKRKEPRRDRCETGTDRSRYRRTRNSSARVSTRSSKSRDQAALDGFEKPRPAPKHPEKKLAKAQKLTGVRRYLSTDGYEILVGRAARDNDNLTFRIAHPNDLWMHTGDYPGSHVVIRNPTRKEIPQRTISKRLNSQVALARRAKIRRLWCITRNESFCRNRKAPLLDSCAYRVFDRSQLNRRKA